MYNPQDDPIVKGMLFVLGVMCLVNAIGVAVVWSAIRLAKWWRRVGTRPRVVSNPRIDPLWDRSLDS